MNPSPGSGVRVSVQDAISRGLVRQGGPAEAILRNAEKAFVANPPLNARQAFDLLDQAAKQVDPGFSAGVPADMQPIVPGQDKLLLNNDGITTSLGANGEITVRDRDGNVIQHLLPPD